ncbi:hypothetical protein [Emticicia fontis]
MESTEEKINALTPGDEVIIHSKPIVVHGTQPLPERGHFLQHRFSESDKHPLWIEILQERDFRKITMTFPLANIQSITVINQYADVEL